MRDADRSAKDAAASAPAAGGFDFSLPGGAEVREALIELLAQALVAHVERLERQEAATPDVPRLG